MMFAGSVVIRRRVIQLENGSPLLWRLADWRGNKLQRYGATWYEEVQRAFYLKIPGVARRARGQQKMLPTLMGGALLETARAFRYEAGVSTLLLSLATYLAAGIPGHGLGSQRAVRRETPGLPTCSPPGEGGKSSVRGRTRISFVIGLGAPKRHDLVSLAPPFRACLAKPRGDRTPSPY